jgi:class 3 adenylate cyclase
MPLYVDIHDLAGATLDQIAHAHAADMAVQDKHGVNYVKYWVNEKTGKVFCMCSAPSAEAAERVHVESSGMRAERIIEVDQDLLESLMGDNVVLPSGQALSNHQPDPGSRTIMFTDIVGSTELTQKLGDHAAMEVVEAHDKIVRRALSVHGGRQVKHLGDGIMAVFNRPEDACACAALIQKEIRQKHGDASPIWLKIGAASGDPLERDGDFFGSTVQLASRLCAHAQAGQTLVSSAVHDCSSKNRFEDVGEVNLKGFTAPVRAHRLVDE